ncbi:SNF2-related protein [Streptomyces prasinus]|uniref:SNF2-related protein n=1 Tax=Streptomyces prasinus TaxID=67345 RepID=UPI003696811B
MFDSAAERVRAEERWEAVSDLREQIRELLSEDEWAAARRNTINAHYTDADLVRSIWGAVRGLGFTGGRVLEPGSGSGNFIGFAPILTLTPVQMTGVEVEPTTAAIARHLYPDAEIITSGLEEVPLADSGFDAVVGNVPYGRYKRYDKVHNADLELPIHTHFVLKSLYATRPGGIVALITSRYTLDAERPDARERMYQIGDLVGAVRLPARAHATAAGTDVVTDVLFLRRRMPGEEPGDKTWLTSRKRVLPGHDDELAVNAYFDAHPEYVLGELRAGSREWGPEVTVVGRTDQAPAEALAAAAAAIAVEARAAGLTAAADQRTEPVQTIVTGGTEGALGLDAEGNPTIINGGRPVPLEVHPDQREQLVQLIRLKGLTLALYEAEADTPEPGETPQLAVLRAELRVAWRDYRKNHPPLTKPRQHYIFTPSEVRAQATVQGLKDVPAAWKQRTAFAWIDDDPDASLLFGLEEWDERTGKGTEQKVLLTRVLEPRTLPARANSHEDAIALAMEYDGGRLDMSRVASLLGLDEESAAAQCADAGLAYRDPEQNNAWEPRHRYLSGNVRTKLAAAQRQAVADPTFQANVFALERVQPADLAPSEIKAKIGAPWIPVETYNDFLAHLGFTDASVLHAGGTVWEVRGAKNGDLARTEWGTGPRPTQDLFTALLRQADSTIQVTYRDNEGRTYVDKVATDEAQEKARLIAEAFDDWVWADEARAARLAGIYNEQFNNLVLPEYAGSALTLPGLISDWTMKEHQNAAIRRIVNEPTALLAHVVGAGKTATMAAGAMELRRTGLATKPCLIVPNHMLKQWSREFRHLYPNAKILAITASDLNKKRRAKFMGRIAGGDWDAVILTHEAFNRVPLRPDTQRNYLDHEMKSLREQLDVAAQAGMGRQTVKQIEESLANAEAKLQQQIDSMDDEVGVFLEDTGVDYVFLDEAHEYKNLRTVSAIPGAAIQGSAKATKLHMVLDYLRTTNESERVATLATGTPIANSVTEAYVLKRYLAPQILEEMGLDAFDNWAATFGEVVSQLEPDPKGDGYKYKARFSRFFNVPELMAAYRTFADVQMAEDLDLPTPPVRENEDGQRGETILIPPTPAQRQFIKELPHQPWVRKPGGVLKALGEGLRASVDLDLVDATEALRNLGLSVTADQITSEDPAYGGRVLDMTKIADLADAAATDMRSLGGSKEMGSKIPYAAEKIAEIWQETKDIVYPVSGDDPTPQDLPGGLQLVFLDEGTPGSTAKHAADLYADLRDELVAKGMPRESIRFIHEAGTDRKKEKLFADCRAGRVRVLVGSTQKMGTGTNIQDRAVALHHLSYPWRPADMAQRDGRIERRGNLNAPWIENTPDDVRVLYYITERTFDEFRLTTLARKARFISQIQRKDFSAREIEDIGADAINLGMLSALASGDPAILQLAEATAERARLQGLARSWDRQQDTRTQQLSDIDDFLTRADTALEGMRAAVPNRRPTTGDAFAMTLDDATYRSRDAAANALGAKMVAIAGDQSIRPGERIPVGTFGGQDFHAKIAYGASGRRQLRLRFAWGHVVPMGQREDRAQWQASSVTQSNGRGAIQSLEHFLNHLDDDLTKLEQSAESLRGRRGEIFVNLRSKDENPYRIQARSKEREEKALGKLVVANEKEADLAERVERAASVNEDAAEEVNEELEALREHIANLRKSIADEHEIQARARGLAQNETRSDDAPSSAEKDAAEAFAADMAEALLPDGSAEPPTASPSAGGAEPQQEAAPAEAQDQPDPDAEPAQSAPEPAAPGEPEAEPSPDGDPEDERSAALADLFDGAASGVGETAEGSEPEPGDDDPLLDQLIAQDMAAMAGEGWTEVVQPFGSQREATNERDRVQAAYERWAATQTALPMLVDAQGELEGEEPEVTNPAGYVASWHHRSRVAASTAGPTGGRLVVEQFEGLAEAARRADAYLLEQDGYASESDRARLLQVANSAARYAQRLAATLDVLAAQRTQDHPVEARMREVRALESAMEYLADQGAVFRLDRRHSTFTDREAAGAHMRDELLDALRQFAELPPERQNLDADARILYGHIRGIPLYMGWHDLGTPKARVVLGFDQLPLLARDGFTTAALEALTPTELIDRIDGKLALDALKAIRDRELAAIQDLLAADVGGETATGAAAPEPEAKPSPTAPDPAAEPPLEDNWWAGASDEAVPEGYQPFNDSAVTLVTGDRVRAGWRQHAEDRHLHYRTVTVEGRPDPRDGYYVGRNDEGVARRFHPRQIVAVPEGSRLLPDNAPAPQETPAPTPTEAAPEETAPLQDLIDTLGDRVSVTHIGGSQPEAKPAEPVAGEPEAPAPQPEPEQHTGPSPAMARCAAVLRYYEPLLQRHKLSGRDVVAYIDRPGVGFSYDSDNPLPELIHQIGKVAERVGGSYRVSYNEWVNYRVGERRQQQSDDLTNLNLDLLTLYEGETEPLFMVDLEAILAAPGTVIELPSEAQIEAEEAAAARIVINHDAEGTEVRNTPRGGDQRIRDALNDLDFQWSRRQQKWYQRRDVPFEDRNTAVRGLRVAFERLGVAYTYNGPDSQDTEETAEAAQQETGTPTAPVQTAPTAEDSVTDAADLAPTRQSTGWAIMAVLSEDQVRGLVSAVAVDNQPVSTQSRRLPGERVREWIAEQRQTPTATFYASDSSDLPTALRGVGDVRLSTRADGLTIEQGDVSFTTLWEELPAWIDAAVAHDTATRSSSLPAWRYGRLDHEIHFRIDERNQSTALALNTLSTALRETTPPTDEQLAAARDKFAPLATTADTEPAPDTAEPATQVSADGSGPAADGEPMPDTDDTEPAPPATAEPENAPAAPTDTGMPEDEPEDADTDTVPEAGDAVTVQTPDGPGTVIGTDDGDLVLVTTQSGTRVWESSEIEWPEGAARPENTDRVTKERQNAADAAQAATAEGIELRYGNGNRLVDLDTEAGHGTVVDADGAVIGWVRARIGDDGRRYWWAQDARGGAPGNMPFHEALPPTAGVPAIRAAGSIRSELHAVKEPAHRSPTPAEYAAREVKLTTAQVRELRRLVLDATYSDGTPIEPPEWVAAHRKYVLNTGQMQALGDAAQAAADAFPGVTAEERRTARVLRNAAERFEYEVYDTARWRATIPPIGERDPYAGPYQPRPRPETPDAPQETADAPAPTPEPATTETQAATGSEAEPAAPADTGTPAPAGEPETAPADPQDEDRANTAPDTPAPDPALTADAAPGPTETAPEDAGAEDEEAQLDLLPSETPQAPAPAHRPGGRQRISRREPAIHPGAEGGPENGRLGVYGHAGHGECDRCGTPDTDRYTMVWAWHRGTEDGGAMAAECGSCVELTTGLSSTEYQRQADVAEARRGGRRIVPRPYAQGDVTGSRTAENEWTYVHQPTGRRYRLAEETPSGYRGFVLRDLYGISQGTGVSTSSGYELAERAALGRTPETHPNDSDDWVFFGYRSDVGKLALHEGESITTDHPNAPRRRGAPFEHGPRWDITVGGADCQVEMVYQQGQPGEDGHRLEVTAPDGTSARYVQWDGVLEWARERVRAPEPERAAAPLAAPLAEVEEALTAAEGIRSALQSSTTSALVQAREAWDRARTHYEAGRLAEGDGHLATARSHAILARFRESAHADFRPLMDAVRRFHDAVDEVLYPDGAGWRPAVGDHVRSRHRYVSESEGFWMTVTAIGPDGIHVQSGMTGDSKTVVQPTDLGPHADLTWQEQPFRAPGEPRASDQERRARLGMPPQAAPGPDLPEPVQTQGAAAASEEEQLDLFAAASPEAPAPPAAPEDTAAPGTESPGEGNLGLVDGESLTYLGDWDGRYEITLPGTSYLLFLPSIEYRRTKFAVASNDEPDSRSPKRLRRFENAEEIMPWVRAHASKQQTGHVFRDGAWTEAPETIAPEPSTDTTATEDEQLPLLGADDTTPAPDPAVGEDPAADASPAEAAAPDRADEDPDQQDQEEAVADEPEPTSVATDVPAVDPPVEDLPAEAPAQEIDEPAVDVEDPPAPRSFTETFPLAADARYQLRLTSVEGEGPREGELRYGEITIAAVRLSASGRWFARMTVEGTPADVTELNGSPLDAAHQGAVMFAVITGEPYGEPPVAADAQGRLSRADVLRAELRSAAEQHLRTITVAAARASADYGQNPQFQSLSNQLGRLGAADTEDHGSQQMAANLTAVQQAVNAWGAALPVDPALDERQHLAFPLLNLLHETTRLHGRLQATLDVMLAERAAAQEQEATAAAPAPAEPARDDSAQQTPVPASEPVDAPGPEQAAEAAATDQPAPSPEVPEDPEMATPARPATPETPEAATPGPSPETEDIPQAEQEAPAAPSAPDPAPQASADGGPGPAADGEPAPGADDTEPDPAAVEPPAAAEPPGELPLWTGPADSDPAEDSIDVVADFAAVQEAWDEHVPADKGTGDDLFATVEDELQRLEALFAEAVAKMKPASEPEAAPEAAPAAAVQSSEPESAAEPSPGEPEVAQKDRDPQQSADAVNTALREADAHAPALRDLPEWQRIQSVRGAFGHLMHVIKERAGERFGKLMADSRVSDYVRRVSIRVCEKVAKLAQAGVDRLRRPDERGTDKREELPSAEALLRLGDAALEYRGSRRGDGGTPPPLANGVAKPVDIPAMRKMGEALNRPLPAGTKRGVSTAAARGRSTTTAKRGGKKAAPGGTEQAGHLRRGGAEQPQARKPTQR